MVNCVKFDRDEVIEKAMLLFWKQGFHATSMRHLQQQVDLRPGSIYASFGSKEGLFKEALKCYADQGKHALEACLEECDTPLQALREFIRRLVIGQAHKAPSPMCMLVKTVAELTSENAALLEDARHYLQAVEKRICGVLETAQQQGELPSNAVPAVLAPYIQMQIMGLRVYTDCSGDMKRVEQMLDQLFLQLKQ